MLILGVGAALAAGTYTDRGIVMAMPEEGPGTEGLGAPTVAHHGGSWVMVVETPMAEGDVPEGCGEAWQLVRATSTDGVAWTMDATPAVIADAAEGALLRCGARHPSLVWAGDEWTLLFSVVGDATGDSIGIGHATSPDGMTWTVAPAVDDLTVPRPDGSADSMGLIAPSISAVGDQFTVMWVADGSLWVASQAEDGSWMNPMAPALRLADVSWATEQLYSPSLGCAEDGWKAWFGAGDPAVGSVWGAATSPNGATWTAAEAPLTAEALPLEGARDLEFVQMGDAWAVYYAADDGIGLASTIETLGEPTGRACAAPIPEDTGDTGDTAEEDTAGEGPDPEGDGDVDAQEDKDGGCGCNAPGAALPGLAMALAAVAAMRRRRTEAP